MHTVAAKAELRADALPRQRRPGLSLATGRECLRPEQGGGGEREPASREEVSAV